MACYVRGHSVKCLGLIAGVSFTRLTPSLCSLFSHPLPVLFLSRKFLETPATQANGQFVQETLVYDLLLTYNL